MNKLVNLVNDVWTIATRSMLLGECFILNNKKQVMKSEPFLWIHAAGLAALPIFLELCWLGLSLGDPLLPPVLEILLIAAIGIVPVLLMQWFRPFYIFSIILLAMKPEALTPEQQRILRFFKTSTDRILAVITALILFGLLWQLYNFVPINADFVPLPLRNRVVGLFLAAIAFLASNLFLQVPVSVFRVFLTPEAAFASQEPYPLEKIRQDFTIPGLQVSQILPIASETLTPATSSLDPESISATSISTPEVGKTE